MSYCVMRIAYCDCGPLRSGGGGQPGRDGRKRCCGRVPHRHVGFGGDFVDLAKVWASLCAAFAWSLGQGVGCRLIGPGLTRGQDIESKDSLWERPAIEP
jgi:hypothetical protein